MAFCKKVFDFLATEKKQQLLQQQFFSNPCSAKVLLHFNFEESKTFDPKN